MTNAEKFVEVFGTDLKRQYATKSWWDQEFVPARTGHWITYRDDLPHVCSSCGEEIISMKSKQGVIVDYSDNFCPNCGAKMEDKKSCDGCCGSNSKWSGESYPGEFEAMEHNGRMDALESEEQA